jgi:hypothetical protein
MIPQRIGLSKREVLKGLNLKIFASYLIPEHIDIVESNGKCSGTGIELCMV